MILQRRSGNSAVEFTLMISLLAAIGLSIMWWMTSQGNDSIGSAQNNAVTAIKND